MVYLPIDVGDYFDGKLVGKYTYSPMDPIGFSRNFPCFPPQKWFPSIPLKLLPEFLEGEVWGILERWNFKLGRCWLFQYVKMSDFRVNPVESIPSI